MQPLRLHVAPELLREARPEIDWTLSTLLIGIGFPWRPVETPDAACDLAYVTPATPSTAAVTVVAAPGAWQADADAFRGTFAHDACRWPQFTSTPPSAPFSATGGRLVVHHDLIRYAYLLLTGHAESRWPLDGHGRFTFQETDPHLLALRHALVSSAGCWLQSRLEQLTGRSAMPRWPAGYQAAIALSHDVDYPEPVRWLEPARVIARLGAGGLGPGLGVALGRRHHWHFRSWMDLERAVGARSAFYFSAVQGSLVGRALGTPDVFYDVRGERFRSVFREIADAGFEVGLHMSYRACETAGQIGRERRRLEAAAGRAVLGGRHHYWRLLPGDPEATLREHEHAGLEYDCSLFHDRYAGWRRATAWPFFPYDRRERRPLRTLQVPTGWMDDQSYGMRRFNPGAPDALLDELLDTTVAQRGCMAVDIHEYVFDPRLFPGWAATYRRLLERAASRGDVWLTAPGDIARHWRQRAGQLLAGSEAITGGSYCAPPAVA